MTVRELIEELERFDEDMEVIIGMQQNYGSDFAMDIQEVESYKVDEWYSEDVEKVVITEGQQIGTVHYNDDEWI
jgi:hypothetical protein